MIGPERDETPQFIDWCIAVLIALSVVYLFMR
jgi:hypothetical protein